MKLKGEDVDFQTTSLWVGKRVFRFCSVWTWIIFREEGSSHLMLGLMHRFRLPQHVMIHDACFTLLFARGFHLSVDGVWSSCRQFSFLLRFFELVPTPSRLYFVITLISWLSGLNFPKNGKLMLDVLMLCSCRSFSVSNS